MSRILVITYRSGKPQQIANLRAFHDALNQSGDDIYDYCMVQDLLFSNAKGSVSITLEGNELRTTYQAIHVKNHISYLDYANAISLYSRHYGVPLVNEHDVAMPYHGKVSQGFLYAINGIPTPDFVSSVSNSSLDIYLHKDSGYPLIIKHNQGIMGLHNYLVHNVSEMHEVLAQPLQGFVAQPYIKNTGELRILTFGRRVDPLIFKKHATRDSHLNNTSRGAGAVIISQEDVAPRWLAYALKAVELTHRDLGGVDVLLAEDGGVFILEVNATPAVASGVFAHEKATKYSEYLLSIISSPTKQERVT